MTSSAPINTGGNEVRDAVGSQAWAEDGILNRGLAAVREEVGEIAGVTAIEVSAQTGRLVITTSGEIDDAQVLAAVEEAGYSAVRA